MGGQTRQHFDGTRSAKGFFFLFYTGGRVELACDACTPGSCRTGWRESGPLCAVLFGEKRFVRDTLLPRFFPHHTPRRRTGISAGVEWGSSLIGHGAFCASICNKASPAAGCVMPCGLCGLTALAYHGGHSLLLAAASKNTNAPATLLLPPHHASSTSPYTHTV